MNGGSDGPFPIWDLHRRKEERRKKKEFLFGREEEDEEEGGADCRRKWGLRASLAALLRG